MSDSMKNYIDERSELLDVISSIEFQMRDKRMTAEEENRSHKTKWYRSALYALLAKRKRVSEIGRLIKKYNNEINDIEKSNALKARRERMAIHKSTNEVFLQKFIYAAKQLLDENQYSEIIEAAKREMA